MATSPDIANYFIGKGNVYTKPVDGDDSLYAHMGNAPRFTVSPSHDMLEHFTDEGGVLIMDDVQLRQRAASVSIAAEEFTPQNLAIALGAVDAGGGVYRVATGFVQRAVKLVGSNEKGAKVQVFLPRVLFVAQGDIDFISETYASLPLSGSAMLYRIAAASSTRTFMDITFLA